ncbi:asparaginase domain-containing protein [Breznakiella homolactica]|uniref:asparaginase domain-containing protein n=1 Tax=Breznakiella homolactica TaxID=2798577 RepID=UPI001CBA68C4|nr:asparaginase domain-containing protein [Breznakiella homolactica]
MYKSHIYLEVRILLLTGVKTFCSCGDEALSCPICREEPGAAPSLNSGAARKAYSVIRSLGGTIIKDAPYERNLSTPKTPDGISLSRLSVKLGVDGAMDISFHRRKKRIRIAEVRVEEDAGRLTHSGSETRMDYSRAGMPSLRIRTAPDFEIGEEAEVFLSDLRRRIQYLEVIPGVPVESVMRCNAYVAIAPYPEIPKNFVKLRNLNSFNFVWKAINTELTRQEEILINGGTVLPESRIWNEAKSITESYQKRKSDEKPRFEPVAGVPPFVPGPDILEALDNFSVELPEPRRDRFMREYGLTLPQAEFVCDEKSRADYYEKTLSLGASPKEAAQWLASYVIKEFKRLNFTPMNSPLTPERLAAVLGMLDEKRIHGGIAKQTITAVLEENRDPEILVRERGWEQLTDREAIEGIVTAVIAANPEEVRRIREGDAGPIQFLTGLVMRESSGLAEPSLVKDVLREQLSVSLIYVLSMGGAISGRINEDGAVESGDEKVLRDLLASHTGTDNSRVRFESIQVGRLLSEEIVPSDWAALIEAVAEKLNSGTANGIVVAHGTDTLPYTAPLLYWLFADANAPVVLAASSSPPGVTSEAADTMKAAIELAVDKTKGVYVVHGGRVLSPLNIKFERIGTDGFRNWNMKEPVFSGSSLLTGPLEADQYVLSQLLEDAANSMCVIRIYPGIRSDFLISLMDKGVRNFFLELYDTGTAGFREGPYSLKRAFSAGKRRQTCFYCTSQQEGIVDFSGYSTSKELWREGAVPMGPLTTETAVARFLAASIIADSESERAELMEVAGPEAASV